MSDLDYQSFHAGETHERDIWAEAFQYPLIPGSNRLIVIRDAEKLTHWDRLQTWLTHTRQLPGVYLVFVSNETDLPYLMAGGKRAGLKPHVAMIKAPRGSLVRCSMPAEDDAVAWVQRRSQLPESLARYLLVRTGGSLADAAAVCAKISLFDGQIGKTTIDVLARLRPSQSFADTLLRLEKPLALLAAADIEQSETGKVIGLLDSRLDLLQALHRIQVAGQSLRDATGVNPYLARQYIGIARHYDPSRCVYRRRVLAVVDDAFRNGARDGVWEALVALW